MAEKDERKNVVPVHNLPEDDVGITVIIDETTPHDLEFGDQYVVGATVLNNKDVRRFGEITEKRYSGAELKFHDIDDTELLTAMLDEAAELGRSFYSVTTTKPKGRKWNRKEDRNVHRNSVKRIIEDVSGDEHSDIHLIIDYNNKVKRGVMENIIESISRNGNITFEMPDSKESFQLMANDLPVGAMGRAYNRGDDTYIKHLKNVKRSALDEDEAIKDVFINTEE